MFEKIVKIDNSYAIRRGVILPFYRYYNHIELKWVKINYINFNQCLTGKAEAMSVLASFTKKDSDIVVKVRNGFRTYSIIRKEGLYGIKNGKGEYYDFNHAGFTQLNDTGLFFIYSLSYILEFSQRLNFWTQREFGFGEVIKDDTDIDEDEYRRCLKESFDSVKTFTE